MKVRHAERERDVERGVAVYYVLFAEERRLHPAWVSPDAAYEISDVDDVRHVLTWVYENAHGRRASIWAHAEAAHGNQSECGVRLL